MRTVSLRRIVSVLALVVCLAGCVATFNQGHYENLTRLKAYHLKLIDDFTVKEEHSFSKSKLSDYQEQGDLKFREAMEYTEPIGDELRINGLRILWELFERHVSELHTDEELLPSVMAEQMKEAIQANYDEAIKGELSRNGAPKQ